jgi:N-acetylglucosaminyldiphosphoundecaprenol N-acetyl-beta-D-mannosaminyltransferase
MIKKQLFSVNYAITDYDDASDLIILKALAREHFGVSALAVHGLMESVMDKSFTEHLNMIDMIVPDGQPVRWALNSFFHVGLKDRVAGPILTRHVLAKAERHRLRIYLYGSKPATLEKMESFIKRKFPDLIISGKHSDRFREATLSEDDDDVRKINESRSDLILVGRGCPRQERWVANHVTKIDVPIMAIGAAFDFFAGNIKHAPQWMQDSGLEWLYRLMQDPRKLWKRYLTTNLLFIYLFILCKTGIRKVKF